MKSLKQYLFVAEAQEKKEITVREWIANWEGGLYNSRAINTMCNAGWFDWFCKDSELLARLKKLARIITKITNGKVLDNYHVWFKNNAPAGGGFTYDDIRFEPMDESERDSKYFVVTCNDHRNPSPYHIWTMKDDNNPGLGFNTEQEVIDAINTYKFL